MEKKEPTASEVDDFIKDQVTLLNQIEGYRNEQQIAFDKNNPLIYTEAENKIKPVQEAYDKNLAEWHEKYGNPEEPEKSESNEIEDDFGK